MRGGGNRRLNHPYKGTDSYFGQTTPEMVSVPKGPPPSVSHGSELANNAVVVRSRKECPGSRSLSE